MFSEKKILIIEAKAQQSFKGSQIQNFKLDEMLIPLLLGEDISVEFICLTSEKYIQNFKKFGNASILEIFKENYIFWSSLADYYNETLFKRAEEIYKQ